MDREEFTSFYTATFHRLVGQLYAMTTESRLSSAGTITVRAKYLDAAHDKIKPLSITIGGKSKAVKKHAVIVIAIVIGPDLFDPSQSPKCSKTTILNSPLFVSVNKDGGFSGSVPRSTIASIARHDGSCGDVTVHVALSEGPRHPPTAAILTAGLILTR